ncbi:unnamed protein product [Rhodiola kirilowii]
MAPPKKRTMKEISEPCSAEYMKLCLPSVRRLPSKLDSPVEKTKALPVKCPKPVPPKAPHRPIPSPTRTSPPPSSTAVGATPTHVSPPPPVIAPSKAPIAPHGLLHLHR